MINKLGSLVHWFDQTARLVGYVLLPYFLAIIAGKCFAEVNCKLMDRLCAYSWTYSIEHELQRALEEQGELAIKPRR